MTRTHEQTLMDVELALILFMRRRDYEGTEAQNIEAMIAGLQELARLKQVAVQPSVSTIPLVEISE